MALIRLMSTDKLHLQDEAWAIYENDVFHVIIEDLPYQDGNDNDSPLARVRFFNNPGLHDLPKTNIFLLKEDAELALRCREQQSLQAYLDKIQTPQDLLTFPLSHTLTGPNIDYPARIAYETKMRRHLSGEDL